MAWELFLENSWRVHGVGLGHIAGVDTSRAERRMVEAGADRDWAETLLAACEVGFVKAVNEKDDDGEE